MAGQVQTIQIPADQETPEQLAARETAEAAALKAGDRVDIHHVNKATGQVIKVAATDGELPVRPDNVPEKFWNDQTGEVNLEALLKSQADGAAEISKLQQAPVKTPEVIAAEKAATEKAAAERTALEPSTSDASKSAIEAAREEYAQNSSLTSETYDKLAASGLDKAMVDGWITGVKDAAAELTKVTYEAAGGEERFTAMAAWAADTDNMPAANAAAINTLLASADPQVAAQGAAQLKTYFDANADIDPNVILTGSGGGSVGAHYESKAQMTADMRNPLYAKDAAFRAKVAQKMAASIKLKVNLFA